jgi:hypothetical protein
VRIDTGAVRLWVVAQPGVWGRAWRKGSSEKGRKGEAVGGVALATCSSLQRGEPIGDNLPTELVLFSLFRTSFALFCLA